MKISRCNDSNSENIYTKRNNSIVTRNNLNNLSGDALVNDSKAPLAALDISGFQILIKTTASGADFVPLTQNTRDVKYIKFVTKIKTFTITLNNAVTVTYSDINNKTWLKTLVSYNVTPTYIFNLHYPIRFDNGSLYLNDGTEVSMVPPFLHVLKHYVFVDVETGTFKRSTSSNPPWYNGTYDFTYSVRALVLQTTYPKIGIRWRSSYNTTIYNAPKTSNIDVDDDVVIIPICGAINSTISPNVSVKIFRSNMKPIDSSIDDESRTLKDGERFLTDRKPDDNNYKDNDNKEYYYMKVVSTSRETYNLNDEFYMITAYYYLDMSDYMDRNIKIKEPIQLTAESTTGGIDSPIEILGYTSISSTTFDSNSISGTYYYWGLSTTSADTNGPRVMRPQSGSTSLNYIRDSINGNKYCYVYYNKIVVTEDNIIDDTGQNTGRATDTYATTNSRYQQYQPYYDNLSNLVNNTYDWEVFTLPIGDIPTANDLTDNYKLYYYTIGGTNGADVIINGKRGGTESKSRYRVYCIKKLLDLSDPDNYVIYVINNEYVCHQIGQYKNYTDQPDYNRMPIDNYIPPSNT